MMTVARHEPVMLSRVVDLLEPSLSRAGAVVVDATLGLGGHAEALLQRLGHVRLVGLDRDPDALDHAAARLDRYADRVSYVHAVYDEIGDVLARLGVPRVQGVLFDLGVSSMQLDDPARGFAYAQDAPLDMRMDPSRGPTAAEVLNTYPAEHLARVLREYGEERYARRIARAVVRERSRRQLTTSRQLADLVRESVPAPARRVGGNPAKRTFQALRIEVNGELTALARALPDAIAALDVGGRVVVLSYHSLEDRLVKRTLAAQSQVSAPQGLPVVPPEAEPRLRLLTRGAEIPSDAELTRNPRAASARLRAAERVREAA